MIPVNVAKKNPQDATDYEKQDAWSQAVLAAWPCILAYTLLLFAILLGLMALRCTAV